MSSDVSSEISHLTFNQYKTHFVCVFKDGFTIYCSEYGDALIHRSFGVPLKIVEMLQRTNLLAYVTKAEPNKVKIWDDDKLKDIQIIKCRNEIKGVKLTDKYIIIVLKYKVELYKILQKEQISDKNIIDTVENNDGLCAVSDDNKMLATLSSKEGTIIVRNIDDQLSAVFSCIDAHESKIVCLTLNSDGTLVATASKRGTIIRIFNTITTKLVKELRRGSLEASVCSISFSSDSKYLACSSNTETIHIFKVDPEEKGVAINSSPTIGKLSESPTDAWSLLKKGLFLDVISGKVNSYVSSNWSIIQVKIDNPEMILGYHSEGNTLIALSKRGAYYKIHLDPDKKECVKILKVKIG